MSSDCIFCKIVQGKAPSAILYETDTVMAILDIMPVNKGHALVIPRAHYDTVLDVPQDLGADILGAVQRVGRAVMKATGADGLNVFQNNFRAAGQIVDHVHWHLVPRFEGDGHQLWAQTPYENELEIETIAQSIRAQIL